jgi:hypothetical protein
LDKIFSKVSVHGCLAYGGTVYHDEIVWGKRPVYFPVARKPTERNGMG